MIKGVNQLKILLPPLRGKPPQGRRPALLFGGVRMGGSSGLFITATGTEIGKTEVACGIVRALKKQCSVGVMKPVSSGCKKVNGVLVSDDALRLRSAAGSKDDMKLINPIRYQKPLAPYCASYSEKERFSLPKVLSAYRKLRRLHDFVIVEGIGGVRVPLSKEFEVTDLIRAMNMTAIVVASAKLGTLNHTLLTLDYLKRKRIKVFGVVLNFYDDKNSTDRTNLRYLKEKGVRVLALIPQEK